MTRDEIRTILSLVLTWPPERQQQFLDIALEIEAELTGAPHRASADELTAIDEGLAGGAATAEEIDAAFATFRRGPD